MDETIDLELLSFQMISAAGEAKSCYMEALNAAKEGDFDDAAAKITEGERHFVEGHHMHTALIQQEAGGNPVVMTLLLTHVEDQMMSAETIRLMAQELIALYQKLAGQNG